MDGSRVERTADACLGVDGYVGAAGQHEAEGWHVDALLGPESRAHRQIALDGMEPEGRLIAVSLGAPGKHANLVEVEGQAGLWRTEDGDVLGNLRVGRVGVGIVDAGEHVCADYALAFGINSDFVGHIHIHAACKQPTGVSGRVAYQPPIFHYRRGRRFRTSHG